MSNDNIKICVRCVMDTTDSKISFDAKGTCDHCRTYDQYILPVWNKGVGHETELEALIDTIKRQGKNREYDCIIGMSGGADSSYLVHLAKVEFGLRPLVFHVDAGWNSQIAVNNIERLIDGLQLTLFTEVINWKEIRDLQLAYFKSGVPNIDIPQDMAFFSTMYKFASANGVRNILTGANQSTECIRNPVEWIYYGDAVQLRDIHRRFGHVPLKSYPISNILWHKVYLTYFRKIKVHRPLNLVPYVKSEAMEMLEKRYGWQPYPQKHFESRFTRFYEGYWLPKKFGFDTRKVQFSSLILTGQMTREEALTRLEGPAYDVELAEQDFDYIAKKLEISREELKGYLEAPNKSYKDYRSQERLYRFGAKAMKMLGLEVGGKR